LAIAFGIRPEQHLSRKIEKLVFTNQQTGTRSALMTMVQRNESDERRETHAEMLLGEKALGIVVSGYKTGGLTLALLIVGAICILGGIGVAIRSPNSTMIIVPLLAIATLIIAFILFEFYYRGVVPARKAALAIEQNKDLLNSVQSAALYLTDIVSEVNDYALLHSNEIVTGIHKAREAFAGIPLAEKLLPMVELTQAEQFGESVRSVAKKSRVAIKDISESISKSDASKMTAHLDALRSLKDSLENEILTPSRQAATQVAAPVVAAQKRAVDETEKLVTALQSVALILTSLVNEVSTYAQSSSDRLNSTIGQFKAVAEHVPLARGLLNTETFRSAERLGQLLHKTTRSLSEETQGIENTIREPNLDALFSVILKLKQIQKQLGSAPNELNVVS
jgi:hypothetical protein